MKKFGKQCAALAVVLALALTTAQPALASYALGRELAEWSTPLGTGTTLTTQTLWSDSRGDRRTEHYVTYTPNSTVKPMVFSGTYVASTNTVETAAAQLEEQGYRVAAAVNGGFFNTDGTIVGMLMTDGVLRSLDVENYTLLGFTEDGQVFLDESIPAITAAWTGLEPVQVQNPWTQTDPEAEPETETVYQPVPRTFPVAGFNAYRNAGYLSGLFLYNQDFSSRVAYGGPNVSVLLRPLEEESTMTMSSALAFEVVSVTDATQEGVEFDGVIPEGCWMLYAEDHYNPDLLSALRALTPGIQMTITVGGATETWEKAVYGVSGRYTLLLDGQIMDGLPDTPNPYTAVGLKPDGTAVFYTIDGRQSGYSIGATYAQVAERLQELGCVAAVALDGGGSTTLGATLPGSGGFSIVNRPSAGERRINNTIALVAPEGSDLFQPGAFVTAEDRVVLAGSRVALTATAYDSTGQPLDSQSLDWSATGGTVTADGDTAVYTAGNVAGTYEVAADRGGGANIQVVNKLTSLNVTRKGTDEAVTALTLEPGAQVDLSVTGMWWNVPVAMDEDAVSWAVDTVIGSVDPTGRFTAGAELAEGSITITAGGVTVTIPVTVYQDCPFTDIASHWSRNYVIRMYELGLTTGYGQPDGTAVYRPGGHLTRAELLAFVTRVLGVDASYYTTVEVPFADRDSIPDWAMPYVQAMYTLKVLKGSEGSDGKLYANVGSNVTREEAMTILGRVLAASERSDLSVFPDGGSVSGWAAPYVQTLVALNVVGGSNGLLNPKAEIDRAAIAKLLVEIYPLEKALLIPRLDLMS